MPEQALRGRLALDDILRRDARVVPGSQGVSTPRIRCRRTSVSWIEWSKCVADVRGARFGGGMTIKNEGAPGTPAGVKSPSIQRW